MAGGIQRVLGQQVSLGGREKYIAEQAEHHKKEDFKSELPRFLRAHGVEFDEALAAKFPYERAYLPVNRKLDGTLWNW